jgi:hypothetical protein
VKGLEIIRNIIENVQYITYEYENENEKKEHIEEMNQQGFEILSNFENRYEVVYRKFFS